MAATDFFNFMNELQVYVPNLPAAHQVNNYAYAFGSPENKLKSLLGSTIYNLLKTQYLSDDADEVLDEGVRLLQASLANLVGEIIFKMEAGERNAGDKKLYKYQEDQQLEVFRNGAHANIGLLLEHLDSNDAKYPTWKETTLYKTREKQLLKTHSEFGEYYYIDESAYYFSKLVFLMKEITADKIEPMVGDLSDLDAETDSKIITKAKQSLAYLTVAMSLRRFDFIEIPKTIRNNVSDSKSRTVRTGYSEDAAVAKVSGEIEAKGIMYLQELDRMMEKKTTGELAEPGEIHEDGDGFYLQP